MPDRVKEKLVELLRSAYGTSFNAPYFREHELEPLADHLIANGVTVLTEDEAKNIYTAQQIEEIQNEAYDLGADSVLRHKFGLTWDDAAGLRKEIKRLQDATKWIPVTEDLPKLIPCGADTAYSEAVNVLTSGRKVLTAIWDGFDWICDAEFWDAEDEEITHWTPVLLPLPQPPKGE